MVAEKAKLIKSTHVDSKQSKFRQARSGGEMKGEVGKRREAVGKTGVDISGQFQLSSKPATIGSIQVINKVAHRPAATSRTAGLPNWRRKRRRG